MLFEESPLKSEADNIVFTKDTSGAYAWTFEFKLTDDAPVDLADPDLAVTEREQDGYFRPLKLSNTDFLMDFERAAYDYINCAMLMASGMFLKVILPARKHLLAHLTRQKLKHVDGGEDDESEPETFVYKAVLKIKEEQSSDTNAAAGLTRQELDVRGFLELDVELVDRAHEQVRQRVVGGIWRQSTAKEVIEAIYHKETEDIKVEGESAFDGVEFAKGFSTEKKEHIIIEQGMPLLNVGHHIHRNVSGVWPTGFNSYIQNRIWYVYPLFNTNRFDDETKTLTIVRVPQALYKSPDNTFVNEEGRLKIIATSDSSLLDATHLRYLSEGDGVRFADADQVVENWMEVKDNKALAKRAERNTEARIDDKSNKDHFTTMGKHRITSNPLYEYSALAARKGQILSFSWENSDHTLLRPGMMCKILYMQGEDVAELEGVLLNAQTSVQLFGQGMTADSYRSTSTLFIFCNVSSEEATE